MTLLRMGANMVKLPTSRVSVVMYESYVAASSPSLEDKRQDKTIICIKSSSENSQNKWPGYEWFENKNCPSLESQ